MNKIDQIVAISDLHGYLPEITKPAEIMLIAGDIFPLNIQFNMSECNKWIETEFAPWVISLPVETVFLVAGNHDAWFERLTDIKLLEFLNICNYKVVYLKNESCEYSFDNLTKVTIFGTPYCHIFGRWPFMREESYMIERFKEIPDKCDIIISHDPPYDISDADKILQSTKFTSINHLGNIPLANRLSEIDYKLVVCGHIHSGDHNIVNKIVNVSLKDENYEPVYEPFYYNLNDN